MDDILIKYRKCGHITIQIFSISVLIVSFFVDSGIMAISLFDILCDSDIFRQITNISLVVFISTSLYEIPLRRRNGVCTSLSAILACEQLMLSFYALPYRNLQVYWWTICTRELIFCFECMRHLQTSLPAIWKPFSLMVISLCLGIASIFRFFSAGDVSNVMGALSVLLHVIAIIFISQNLVLSLFMDLKIDLLFLNFILAVTILAFVISIYVPMMVFGNVELEKMTAGYMVTYRILVIVSYAAMMISFNMLLNRDITELEVLYSLIATICSLYNSVILWLCQVLSKSKTLSMQHVAHELRHKKSPLL